MRKTGLVEVISERTGMSKVKSSKMLSVFMDAIAVSLSNGEDVTITGFGTFSAVKRASRKGRNPQTGKEITISARTVVRFKPGSILKDTINSGVKIKGKRGPFTDAVDVDKC